MSKNNQSKRAAKATPPPLFNLRFLVLATVSVVIGIVVGVLTLLACDNPWAAILAGLSAAGVTLGRLHDWTSP